MIDTFLSGQNKCLIIIDIMMIALMISVGTFALYQDCPGTAIIFISICASIILSLSGVIVSNMKYIKENRPFSGIEQSSTKFPAI